MAVGEIGLLEGFDRYSSIFGEGSGLYSSWISVGGFGNDSALIPGRFGFRAYRLNCTFGTWGGYRTVPASNLCAYGFGFICLSSVSSFNPANSRQYLSDVNGYKLLDLRFNNDGTYSVYTINGTVEVFRSEPVFNYNIWEHFAFEFECSATQGRIKHFYRGEFIFELSGIDTKGASLTGEARRFYIMTASDVTLAFDDILYFYGGGTWPGECKLTPMTEIADAGVQFTRLSGAANFEMIDELQIDLGTTYNYSETVGHEDLFELENMVDTPDRIFGLQVTLVARKDDAGTRVVNPVMEVNGVKHLMDDCYLTSSYVIFRQARKVNQNTNQEYTKSDIDGMKLGYRITQ